MKTTHKKTICELINVSTKFYDAILWESFWRWCQIHGQHPSLIQQLLANKSIFNWYMAEFRKCESDFLEISQVIQKGDIKTLRTYYRTSIECLQAIYPSALIRLNNQNKAFSKQYINNLTYIAN